MNSEEERRIAFDVLANSSRNDLGENIEFFNREYDISIQELSDYACSLSVIAAELSEYLGYRGGYGVGDHGHDAALLKADKKRKKIRKALGYSYP